MADFKISLNLVTNENNAVANLRSATAALRELNRESGRASRGRGGVGAVLGLAPTPGARGKRNPFGVSMSEMQQLAASMEHVGRVARNSLHTPITLASDFESAILKVNALSGGTDGMTGNLDRIAAKSRELGKATEFTATQVAEGMQVLTQAGFSAEERINSISTVLDFATFGQVSMAKSADLVGAAMGGFGLEGEEAAKRVGNSMARIAVSTQADVSDIGMSFRKAAPMARTLGLSVENVGTALSVLGKGAIRGGEAGTALKSIFATLSGPKSTNAKKALQALGISPKAMRDALNSGDLKNVLKLFADGFAKNGITGTSRVGLLTAIIGKHHVSKFEQLVQSLEVPSDSLTSWDSLNAKVLDTNVELHSAAETMRGGVKGNMKALESAMEELGITIGQKLLPTLLPLIKGAITSVGVMSEWADKNETLVKAFARVALALAIAGPALGAFLRVAQTLAIIGRLTGATRGLAAAVGSAGAAAVPARTRLGRLGSLAGGAFTAGMVGAAAIIGVTIYKLNQLRETSRNTLADIRNNAESIFSRGEHLTESLSTEDLAKRKRQLESQIAAQQAKIDAAKQEDSGFVSFVSDAMFGGRDHGETALEGLEAELAQVKGALGRGGTKTVAEQHVQKFINSLGVISRAGVATADASKVKNKHDAQLRVLVKLDQQGKYVDTIIDEMSSNEAVIVEGI